MLGLNLENIAFMVVNKLGSQVFEAQKVRVQASSSNLVTTGFGHGGLAEATQQRAYHQHTAPKRGTFLHERHTVEVGKVELVGLKREVTLRMSRHFHTDFLQQLDEVIDVEYLGNVLDSDRVGRQQRGTDDLQCLVLGSLRRDFALQPMPSFDDE